MSVNYQADVVTVNNYYQPEQSYLSALIALARWSSNSITIYSPDRQILHHNNKGRCSSVHIPVVKNLEQMMDFLLPHTKNIDEVYNAALQVYRDCKERNVKLYYHDGSYTDMDIIPSFDGIDLRCVVVVGRYVENNFA